MNDRATRKEQRQRTSRRGRFHMPPPNPHAAHPAFDGWVRLASSGWYVRLVDVLNQPTVATLAGEDATWHFAVCDWQARKPPVTQWAARRAWREEARQLSAKRERLMEATASVYTLRPTPKEKKEIERRATRSADDD